MNPDQSTQDLIDELKVLPQLDIDVVHHFSELQYTRMIRLGAGDLIVGKMHRNRTLNILMQGEIAIYMGRDEPARILSAPCIFESEAGVQKVIYSFTNVVFANVHVTQETDLHEIENLFIVPEAEYSLNHDIKKFIGQVVQ